MDRPPVDELPAECSSYLLSVRGSCEMFVPLVNSPIDTLLVVE